MVEVGGVKNAYQDVEDKDWNLNQNFSSLLTDIIKAVNLSAQAGDLHGWWTNLRILYRNVVAHEHFKQDVADTLNMDFMEAKKHLQRVPFITNPQSNQNSMVAKIKATKILDRINLRLVGEMYDAGLIFPVNKKRDVKYSSLELR